MHIFGCQYHYYTVLVQKISSETIRFSIRTKFIIHVTYESTKNMVAISKNGLQKGI